MVILTDSKVVDGFSGLLVDEDVVVLGLEPVESQTLKVDGLLREPSLDEVAHELHWFVMHSPEDSARKRLPRG